MVIYATWESSTDMADFDLLKCFHSIIKFSLDFNRKHSDVHFDTSLLESVKLCIPSHINFKTDKLITAFRILLGFSRY